MNENEKVEKEVVDIEGSSLEKELNGKKYKIIKYGIYIIILILSLIVKNISVLNSFNLGDFGSIVPLLLQIVALMGFKWLPILSLCGLLITFFEHKLGDFSKSFLVIVLIITITSLILLFVI